MNRWSMVFFVWAIAAAALGVLWPGPLASSLGRFFFVLFAMMFLFISLQDFAALRRAQDRLRP